MDISVIGGGISGIAAAYHLRQRLSTDDTVTLYEADAMVGGVIRSDRLQGVVIEGGPDTLFIKDEVVRHWISELGLDQELVYPRDDVKPAWRITVDGDRTGPSSTENGVTFSDGMGALPKRAAQRFGETIRCGTSIAHLEPTSGASWRIHSDGHVSDSEAVVLATPASTTGDLVESWHTGLAHDLNTIVHRPRAVVVGLYRASAIPDRLQEHAGFWNDPDTPWLVDACTVLSRKWAYPENGSHIALRTFWGAHGMDVPSWSDNQLIDRHRQELEVLARVFEAPLETRIYRWNSALPQLGSDQQAQIQNWSETLAHTHPSIAMVGAFHAGLGVGACIADAFMQTDRLLARLGMS